MAGPDVLSIREVGGVMGEVLGVVPRFQVVDDLDAPDLVPDLALLRRRLPPLPRIPFRRGVTALAAETAGAGWGAR